MMGIQKENQIILIDTDQKNLEEKFDKLGNEIIAQVRELSISTGIGGNKAYPIGLKWSLIKENALKMVKEGWIRIDKGGQFP